MFSRLHCALERWARANPARLDNRFNLIPPWYIHLLSRTKLVQILRYVYRSSPSQRQLWRNAGIKLSDLRSPQVLQHIPFITADDLADHPKAYCCVPEEQLIHIVGTSGTKNRRKKIYLTAEDFDHQTRMIATNLRRFPGVSCVAAMFLVHDPTWSNGTVVRRAVAMAGMLGFLSGEHLSTQDQIELIKRYGVNCLVSTPSYISRLTVQADQDLSKLGVRYIQLGGQPWTEALRADLQQAWAAKVIDTYGCAESIFGIASECIHQNGLHFAETDFWIEIIDPATGQVLPDGQEGELVFTTLSRRGMPLIRYRTGDLSRLIPPGPRCPCGMHVRKMGRIRGRLDDVLIIGTGYNLYPDELDNALLSIPGVTDYQLTVDRESYTDVLHLKLEANGLADNLKNAATNALLSIPNIRISHDLTRVLSIGRVESVPLGSLSTDRPKSIRIIDRRPSHVRR